MHILSMRLPRAQTRASWPFPSFSAPSINLGDPEPTEECITKQLWLEAGSEACEVFRIGDGSFSVGEQQHSLPQSVRIRAVDGEAEPVSAHKMAEQAEVVRDDGGPHRARFHKYT